MLKVNMEKVVFLELNCQLKIKQDWSPPTEY